MYILIAILIFSFLIFIHEFGHFITAKLSGIQVNEFSMFMGPAIFKKQHGETLYTIRCIPIGGYCAMEGEDEDSDNPRAFGRAAWWKRLIVLVAGATMNFLAGLALLGIVFAPAEAFIVPTVSQIEPQCSLGGSNGIQVGDRLLEMDGEKIYVASDFSTLLTINGGDVHDFVVERDGKKVTLTQVSTVMQEFTEEDGTTSLRYGFSFSVEENSPTVTLQYVWSSARNIARMVRLSLKMLVTGKAGLKDVGGPVMIVQQINQVAEESSSTADAISNVLYFGAFIAINLAIMNLLPFPALDGGRAFCLILTTVAEKITRKKINPKYEAYLHGAGMVVLLLFMAIITFKDIIGIFRG